MKNFTYNQFLFILKSSELNLLFIFCDSAYRFQVELNYYATNYKQIQSFFKILWNLPKIFKNVTNLPAT